MHDSCTIIVKIKLDARATTLQSSLTLTGAGRSQHMRYYGPGWACLTLVGSSTVRTGESDNPCRDRPMAIRYVTHSQPRAHDCKGYLLWPSSLTNLQHTHGARGPPIKGLFGSDPTTRPPQPNVTSDSARGRPGSGVRAARGRENRACSID
jgi:hypothetical protein